MNSLDPAVSSLTMVQQMLRQITTAFHPELVGEMVMGYWKVFLVMALGYLLHWLPSNFKDNLQVSFRTIPDFAKATVIVMIALLLFQVKTADSQPFIYFQF